MFTLEIELVLRGHSAFVGEDFWFGNGKISPLSLALLFLLSFLHGRGAFADALAEVV
jgi:hypothetical protein